MRFTAGDGIQKMLEAPTASPRRLAPRVTSIADILAGPGGASRAPAGPSLTEQILTGPELAAADVVAPVAPEGPGLEPAGEPAVVVEVDEGAAGPPEA